MAHSQKSKERIEKFKQTGNTDLIYKSEIDKACFQHDMAYGKSKDLVKRTKSDKVLKDKAFKIVINPNYHGYQRGLASVVYKCFDKKYKGSGIVNEPNYQLAKELHKPIIKKSKKRKVYSYFRDNIWVLICLICNHWVNITKESSIYYVKLICLVNMHGLFLWKTRGISIVNAFQKIISKRLKPNKIWVDQGGKFYNMFILIC